MNVPILRAKETFHYPGKDGYTLTITGGHLFDSADPCVKGREHLFESVEAAAAAGKGAVEVAAARAAVHAIETASAAPGERRSRSAPQKHAPAKAQAQPDDDDKSDEAEEK